MPGPFIPTHEQKRGLAHAAQGTCFSASYHADRVLGVTVEEDVAEDWLLDMNVERCAMCGWWHESCELKDSKTAFGFTCESCEPEDDE